MYSVYLNVYTLRKGVCGTCKYMGVRSVCDGVYVHTTYTHVYMVYMAYAHVPTYGVCVCVCGTWTHIHVRECIWYRYMCVLSIHVYRRVSGRKCIYGRYLRSTLLLLESWVFGNTLLTPLVLYLTPTLFRGGCPTSRALNVFWGPIPCSTRRLRPPFRLHPSCRGVPAEPGSRLALRQEVDGASDPNSAVLGRSLPPSWCSDPPESQTGRYCSGSYPLPGGVWTPRRPWSCTTAGLGSYPPFPEADGPRVAPGPVPPPAYLGFLSRSDCLSHLVPPRRGREACYSFLERRCFIFLESFVGETHHPFLRARDRVHHDLGVRHVRKARRLPEDLWNSNSGRLRTGTTDGWTDR